MTDNFFDLGGHSLLVIQVQRRIKEVLEREIPTRYRSAQVIFAHSPEKAREAIATGQREHIALLDAIRKGEGSRADFLMQEHVHMPHRFLTQLLDNPETEVTITPDHISQIASRPGRT